MSFDKSNLLLSLCFVIVGVVGVSSFGLFGVATASPGISTFPCPYSNKKNKRGRKRNFATLPRVLAKVFALYFFAVVFAIAALYYVMVNVFTAFVWGFATFQILLFVKVYKHMIREAGAQTENEPWFLSAQMLQYYYPAEITFYVLLIIAFSVAGLATNQLFWDNSSYFMTAIASFIALKWCILSYRMSKSYLADKNKMNQTPLISSIGEIA